MPSKPDTLARGIAVLTAVVLAAGSGFAVSDITSDTTTVVAATTTEPMGCEDWTGNVWTQRECHAAGTLRFVSLVNLQGGSQFCVWQRANPGEWNRLKGYASSGAPPSQIVTWFGGSILNELQAYFALQAPTFEIPPNNAPNKCKTPLPPPSVQSATPGETDVTVTVGP